MQARRSVILIQTFGIVIVGMGEWSARAAVGLPRDLTAPAPSRLFTQAEIPCGRYRLTA